MPLHSDHAIESPTSGKWIYVKSGHMVVHETGETVAAVSGAFDGFRIEKNKRFEGYQLHIRILDGENVYIVAGELEAYGKLQTWARMFLGRVGHPSRPITHGDRIRLEVLAWEGPRGVASLCRVSPEDDLTDLEEARIESPEDLRAAIGRLVESAPWSSGAGYLPSASELPMIEERKTTKPTTENAEIVPDDDLPF